MRNIGAMGSRGAVVVLLTVTGACGLDGPELLPPPRDAAAADAPHCDPLEACGDACADVKNDPMNCGACGNVCALSANRVRACAMGVCVTR